MVYAELWRLLLRHAWPLLGWDHVTDLPLRNSWLLSVCNVKHNLIGFAAFAWVWAEGAASHFILLLLSAAASSINSSGTGSHARPCHAVSATVFDRWWEVFPIISCFSPSPYFSRPITLMQADFGCISSFLFPFSRTVQALLDGFCLRFIGPWFVETAVCTMLQTFHSIHEGVPWLHTSIRRPPLRVSLTWLDIVKQSFLTMKTILSS